MFQSVVGVVAGGNERDLFNVFVLKFKIILKAGEKECFSAMN